MTKQEAIRTLHELWRETNDCRYAKAYSMAIEALVLEQPKGKWIENDDFTCSECGYHMIVGGGAYNFCPNCGADMRGDKE